jgi:hypothetical protein
MGSYTVTEKVVGVFVAFSCAALGYKIQHAIDWSAPALEHLTWRLKRVFCFSSKVCGAWSVMMSIRSSSSAFNKPSGLVLFLSQDSISIPNLS